MAGWRMIGSLLVVFAASGASAQEYNLTNKIDVGSCWRTTLAMDLKGEIRIARNGQRVPLKLSASARHEFMERLLADGSDGMPGKTARVYERAAADIRVDGDRSLRSLRPERRLVVAQRPRERFQVYSPAGPLTREELELTAEHFNTLAVGGLAPGKAVAVHETWKVSSPVAQALCGFEGLTEQTLFCKLTEIKDKTAHVTISGTATGIDLGALVKLTIEGSLDFDLAAGQWKHFEWKQKDDRDQGPVSPISASEATFVADKKAIDRPEALSEENLGAIPQGFDAPTACLQLELKNPPPPKLQFTLLYDREWQKVSQTDEHVVFRLLERGDFIAQATITPWTKAEKNHMTPAEFQQAMAATPGWEQDEETQSEEVPAAEKGYWIYRIAASGELDGVRTLQIFYLVACGDGRQVVVAFTLAPKQASKLGARDLDLVGNLRFPVEY
jgi:hypothetical protein